MREQKTVILDGKSTLISARLAGLIAALIAKRPEIEAQPSATISIDLGLYQARVRITPPGEVYKFPQ